MLTLHSGQWNALGDRASARFREELVVHLGRYAPELAKAMGEARLRQVVDRGMARAKAHGFSNRGPMRFYLECMLALGSDFDTDPVLAQATRALREAASSQAARSGALYEGIVDYFERVNGPGNVHALAAMRRVRDNAYESFTYGGEVAARALVLFRGGFPEKYAYAGEPALRALVDEAVQHAASLRVQDDAGRLLIATLLYGFGHGVITDPAYFWVGDTLRGAGDQPAEDRLSVVYRTARVYLHAALKNLAP